MLQISDLSQYGVNEIENLLDKVKPVLQKRANLHKKYTRNADDSHLLYSSNVDSTKLPFEKFIVDIASGYTSGKPLYNVNCVRDEETKKLLKELFDKDVKDDDYVEKMSMIIKYITSYNDDEQENYDLIHDLFELTSCYEIIYENEDNEVIYSRYSPLQTVACWDYSIPANLTGLIRTWDETIGEKTITKVELTDQFSIRTFQIGDRTELVSDIPHNWNDVPAFAVETPFAIFETCEDVISAYEQLVQNVRNTYQYNDSDCKLKITNYVPDNPMTITDDEGKVVVNPARELEDQMWIDSRTIYVGENGNVEWLSKPVDASGFTTNLKAYSDLMFQLAGIPNTSDLAFNSTDLNTSAIDRKFYIMNMATASIVSQLKKAYLRRWELIFNRVNMKKGTSFDFRDILVELPKNLPANDDEMIASLMKLKGTISDETLITKLGYDYNVERTNIDEETEERVIRNIEQMQMQRSSGLPEEDITKNSTFVSYDTSKKGVERDEMDQSRQTSQE